MPRGGREGPPQRRSRGSGLLGLRVVAQEQRLRRPTCRSSSSGDTLSFTAWICASGSLRPISRISASRVERGEGVAQRDGAALAGGLHLLARVGDRIASAIAAYAGLVGVGAERLALADLLARATRAPHGVCASRWALEQLGRLGRRRTPGGTRRLISARALACTDGVAPTTGGQSMPSTVTAGRAQMRSATVPVPISSHAVQHLGVLAELRLRRTAGRPTSASPVRPSTVVVPSSARSESSTRISAASASGAAPPNWPECRLPSRVSIRTRSSVMPRSVAVTVGSPTRKLPASPMTIGVGGEQLRVRLGVPLQTAGALLLRALGDHLDVDRDAAVRLQGAQREQVHDARRPCSRRRRARTSGRRARSARTAGTARRPRPAAAARRSARRAARSARPPGRAGSRTPTGCRRGCRAGPRPGSPRRAARRRPSSRRPRSRSCGNWSKSATDLKATSSVSSAFARGISEATVSATGFDGHGHAPCGCDVVRVGMRCVRAYAECRCRAHALPILPQRASAATAP